MPNCSEVRGHKNLQGLASSVVYTPAELWDPFAAIHDNTSQMFIIK